MNTAEDRRHAVALPSIVLTQLWDRSGAAGPVLRRVGLLLSVFLVALVCLFSARLNTTVERSEAPPQAVVSHVD